MGAISAIAVVATVVIGFGPARAGGSQWNWDQFAYEPGQTVYGSAGVWITSPQGRPEDGPYHAYLLPAFYEWPEGAYNPAKPEESIYLADITVVPYEDGATHSTARLTFTMPDVEPGEYSVHHCNDPCTKTFGDIMETGILVVANESEERLIRRIEKLESQIFTLRYRLNHDVRRWDRRVEADVGERVVELTDRVDALEQRIAKLQPAEDGSETEALSYLAGGGLLGLAAAGAAFVRRRRD